MSYNSAKNEAARLLIYYIKNRIDESHWDSDNDSEVKGIIDDIGTMIEEKIKDAMQDLFDR